MKGPDSIIIWDWQLEHDAFNMRVVLAELGLPAREVKAVVAQRKGERYSVLMYVRQYLEEWGTLRCVHAADDEELRVALESICKYCVDNRLGNIGFQSASPSAGAVLADVMKRLPPSLVMLVPESDQQPN